MPVRGALAVWPPSIVTLMLVPFTVYVCSAESLLMSWRVSFAVADTHAGVNARPCISTSSVVVGVSQVGAAPVPVLQAAPSPLRAKTASATATHRIRPGSLRDGGRRHHRRLPGVGPDRALLLACLDLTSLGEDEDESTVDALCNRAVHPVVGRPELHVAGVCVWPRWTRPRSG